MAPIFSSLKSQIASFTSSFSANFTPVMPYVKKSHSLCQRRVWLGVQLSSQLLICCNHLLGSMLLQAYDLSSPSTLPCPLPRPCAAPSQGSGKKLSLLHCSLFDCRVPPWIKSSKPETKVLTQIPGLGWHLCRERMLVVSQMFSSSSLP